MYFAVYLIIPFFRSIIYFLIYFKFLVQTKSLTVILLFVCLTWREKNVIITQINIRSRTYSIIYHAILCHKSIVRTQRHFICFLVSWGCSFVSVSLSLSLQGALQASRVSLLLLLFSAYVIYWWCWCRWFNKRTSIVDLLRGSCIRFK